MNAAHLHLLLVHIPVVVVPLGFLVLLCGVRRDSLPITRTALIILFAASLIAIPTFLSGSKAEEIVEHLPGISEHLIEEHAEAAEIALWLTLGVSVLSVLSLLAIKAGAALERTLLRATLLLSFVSGAALAYTANEGGRIRHPEAFSTEQLGADGDIAGPNIVHSLTNRDLRNEGQKPSTHALTSYVR